MNATDPELPTLIDCETAARALYDFLDGRLPVDWEAAVRRHVDTCAECAGHYRFARRVMDLLPASLPLGGESLALRARIVASLRDAGYREPGQLE